MEYLGPPAKRHKDWFDENHSEIIDLLERKRAAHLAHLREPSSAPKKDALKRIRSTVQLKLRAMQDSWLSAKADEIQSYADQNDMQKFYSSLKAIYGPTSACPVPLLSVDGTKLIADKDMILERWVEHFNGI